MPRPSIDLKAEINKIASHVEDLPPEAGQPLSHFNRSLTDLWNFRAYTERKVQESDHYPTAVARHFATLDRMLLVHFVESFERFLKELAAVCVDHLAKRILDDRFRDFHISPGELAAHFEAGTIGKALCESGTWLNCNLINDRFRRMLTDPFQGAGDFWLFPKTQQPADERFRYPVVSLLWQLRHTIVHNVGVVTHSDALKLRLLTREWVTGAKLLVPTRDDLRHVRSFLDESARKANERVGTRLAELLSSMHQDNPNLFAPQEEADSLSNKFGMQLTVAQAAGVWSPT
ncbi:MAG: hypothetical protein HQ581_21685 [Planctomycetes bacterium]|nr:hypothetical protein [Planctomycetota bacterium]